MKIATALALALTLFVTQQPVRDAARARTGTAAIAGVIVADDAESRPIARATVTLSGSELRPNLIAVTDDAGRFVFPALPAGLFTLSAAKLPFITMALGQTT